ncbi:MAG TPA: hypothetical protein VFA04_07780 [Bryobacteraceae bacterium]|nr:hypothetical protein [Bryobacteraceae bacterium]
MSAGNLGATPIDADGDSNHATTIQELKALVLSQQKQIEELRTTLAKQQQTLDKLAAPAASPAATDYSLPNAKKLGEVATATAMIPAGPGPQKTELTNQPPTETKAPLSWQLGDATFTPLGFMDFTSVWRSTDIGTGIGTTFSAAPYNNTVLGRMPENHFSTQNSRVGFKVDSEYHDMKIRGYLEADFLGNPAGSLAVTSNANTMRMRLYWVDLTKSNIEFLAGQSWSMMTPNRKGISPMPGDIFYSQDMDTNYQNGLVWTRAAQVRVLYHGGDHFTWGFAAENPEQYVGGGVVFPATLPASFAPEFNAGSNTLATPNYAPDIQSKMAFDGKHAHLEIAGLFRSFHSFLPGTSTTPAKTDTAIGAGGEINSNFEIVPGLRLIENAYWSDGGGRYIGNTGAPDIIVRPDGSISPVHSGSTVDGFEWTFGPHKQSLLYAYYGGAFIRRNLAIDSAGKVSGYGVPGNGGANRSIQEGTFGWVQTFWKNERLGDMKLITQYSYLWRYPWLVTGTNPRAAHSNMVWLDIRYDLP